MEVYYVSEISVVFFLLLCIVLGFALGFNLVRKRIQKSLMYRKYLVNLFIAGRIRQEAEKKDVDLEEEELNFLNYEKTHEHGRKKRFDEKIESDLMDNLEFEEEKKPTKKK